MNLSKTIGTHPSFPSKQAEFKKKKKKKEPKTKTQLSAVHMPFKVAPDSTYHYTTINPTIKNPIHAINSALNTAGVVGGSNMCFICL